MDADAGNAPGKPETAGARRGWTSQKSAGRSGAVSGSFALPDPRHRRALVDRAPSDSRLYQDVQQGRNRPLQSYPHWGTRDRDLEAVQPRHLSRVRFYGLFQ